MTIADMTHLLMMALLRPIRLPDPLVAANFLKTLKLGLPPSRQ
jgi:hypothetical protein